MLAALFLLADAPIDVVAVQPSAPALRIDIGDVRVHETGRHFAVRDLALSSCVVRPLAADTLVARAPVATDAINLDVVVRHHHTQSVAISSMDPGFAWVEPCVERQVVGHRWEIRDGRVEVPILVTRAPQGPDAVIVAPAPAR